MSIKFVFTKDGIYGAADRVLDEAEMTAVREAFDNWMEAAEDNSMLNPMGPSTCAQLLGQAMMTVGPKGSSLRRSFMSILAVVDNLASRMAEKDGATVPKDN